MIGRIRFAVIGCVAGLFGLLAGTAPAATTEESPAIVVSPRDGEIGPGSVVTFVFPDGLAAPVRSAARPSGRCSSLRRMPGWRCAGKARPN
jgi:hypothetical protein